MSENKEVDTKTTSFGPERKQQDVEGNPTANLYKWYHINTAMIPAKLAYLFETSKRLGYTTNLVSFLTEIGLNKSQAGLISGLRLLGMMFGAPFWGILADKYKTHKLIITFLCIFSIAFTCSQGFLSVYYGDKDKNVCRGNSISNMTLEHSKIHDSSSTKHSEIGEEFDSKRLLIILIVVNVIACFFEGGIPSFIDSGVVRQIQMSTDRPVLYGKQRLYGSIGAAIGIAVTNSIVSVYPRSNVTCYAGIFMTYLMFTILEYVFMMLIYRVVSFKEEEVATEGHPADLKDVLKKTLIQFEVLFFYFSVFVSGILYAQYTSFTSVYLKELGAESFLLTLTMVISSLSGIGVNYFAEQIINLVGGPLRALCATFFIYFVRYLIFALVTNPWFLLFAQPLHAFSSTLTIVACISHIKKIAPPQIVTTMCSLFNNLHFGVGNIVGSSIGGVVYEHFGGKILFMSSCTLGLLWCIVIILQLCCNRRGR